MLSFHEQTIEESSVIEGESVRAYSKEHLRICILAIVHHACNKINYKLL